MFGAELVDDFRACTCRIGLLFAAHRPMRRAIVAVNWNDRLQIRGRSWSGGSTHLPLSSPLSYPCPLGRTCVSRYAGARDRHFAFSPPHFGWSMISMSAPARSSPLPRSPCKKSVEKALYRVSYVTSCVTNINRAFVVALEEKQMPPWTSIPFGSITGLLRLHLNSKW